MVCLGFCQRNVKIEGRCVGRESDGVLSGTLRVAVVCGDRGMVLSPQGVIYMNVQVMATLEHLRRLVAWLDFVRCLDCAFLFRLSPCLFGLCFNHCDSVLP